MRHRKKKIRLGRTTSHKKATMSNMARALFLYQEIKTTKVKAKQARILVDNLITIAKKNTPFYQRMAFSMMPDKKVVQQLFKEIAPRFTKRTGGYTRIIPLNFRRGDGANMVILELTEKKVTEKPKLKQKKEAGKTKETPVKPAEKRSESKAPAEVKPAAKTKTAVAEKPGRGKAKQDERKGKKGFIKGLRGFFRSRTP